MTKSLKIVGLCYAFFALVGIFLFFWNFTSSAEINFIFRIIGASIVCIVPTYPLVLATSKQTEDTIPIKVLLYGIYVGLASAMMFLLTKTFYDHNFLFNGSISKEAFTNSQRNCTTFIYSTVLIMLVNSLIGLSIKLYKKWPDWIDLILKRLICT